MKTLSIGQKEEMFVKLYDLIPDMPHAIMAMCIGSLSHNTYIPSDDPNSIDDKDFMVVVIPSIDHFYGSKEFGSRGTKVVQRDGYDIVVYDIRKYIGLLAKGNINVVGTLFLNEEFYIKNTNLGDYLLKHRDLFLTKAVFNNLLGYARDQFKKMTALAFEGYMGEKRKRLVQKYGYDCKNAAHLIRLLSMCVEFAVSGEINVFRTTDRGKIIDIKTGKWTLEEVKKEAEILFNACQIHEPKLVNMVDGVPPDVANRLCVNIVQQFFSHGMSLTKSIHERISQEIKDANT